MRHLELDELLAYWLAEQSAEETARAEDHLFECTACATQLDALHRTAAATVALVRRGEVGGWATHALVNRMSRDRVNMRQYICEPGETIACTVAPGDDYLMGRFVLPKGESGRLDVRVHDPGGVELMRISDLAVDARSRHAIMFMPARPTLGAPSMLLHYVLVTPTADGDREVARYSMDHTSSSEA